MVDRDYDQTALVYANFGSTLPIAGALAGGPAVGAALLLFSEIFKSPLRQMGRVSYGITGSWEEPVIEKTGSQRAAPSDDAASSDLPQDNAQTEAQEPQ